MKRGWGWVECEDGGEIACVSCFDRIERASQGSERHKAAYRYTRVKQDIYLPGTAAFSASFQLT